jgi:hypothetical protein
MVTQKTKKTKHFCQAFVKNGGRTWKKSSGTIFHEPCILGRARRVKRMDALNNLTSLVQFGKYCAHLLAIRTAGI